MIFISLAGFQTWIGYEDVKSSPTYFFVRRSENGFNQSNIPIPFEIEMLNVGWAMNLTSGKFTSPRTGKYFFSASGPISFTSQTPNPSRIAAGIQLVKNGEVIGYSPTDSSNNSGWELETFSIQLTTHLQTGDKIWLTLSTASPAGVYLYGYGSFHFTGFVLEEEAF